MLTLGIALVFLGYGLFYTGWENANYYVHNQQSGQANHHYPSVWENIWPQARKTTAAPSEPQTQLGPSAGTVPAQIGGGPATVVPPSVGGGVAGLIPGL